VLALAPDASASTKLPCLAYINVPLSTYCKIRYASKFAAASRGSPWDSTAFLYSVCFGLFFMFKNLIDISISVFDK